MLLQKILCSSWQRQMLKQPSLHHLNLTKPQQTQNVVKLLRSFRNNTVKQTPQNNRIQVTPFENIPSSGNIPPGNVIKAFVFTGSFTIGCFMGATILEYENTRNMMIRRARDTKFSWMRTRVQFEQQGYFEKVKYQLKNFWEELTAGQRIFVPICALNVLVFGLWRVPALRNTMLTYFCSNPAARVVCWPMFLSTFSHYSLFHIFANMYVLHSFSSAAVMAMGKEQFLAVYLSAGVIASMSSVVYKALSVQPGLSLGASGAIMTILAFVCARYPDTQLSILFLPGITFSAGSAIKVIMGIDFAGCLLGWKFFDHAAHLGGATFGIFWALFGEDMWQKRIPFLTMYHDWRKTK